MCFQNTVDIWYATRNGVPGHTSTMRWTPYVCNNETAMTCRPSSNLVSDVAMNIDSPTKERYEPPLRMVIMVT